MQDLRGDELTIEPPFPLHLVQLAQLPSRETPLYIGEQIATTAKMHLAIKLPKGAQYELERQYYDLASIGMNPAGMAGLRMLMPASQLVYGSDEPFLSSAQLEGALQKLGFSADESQAVQRNNALRLFPRLQS